MAEEYFQGEVSGGNWWNSSRNIFGSSLCSSNIPQIANLEYPNYGMIMDMNTRSNDEYSSSPSDGSIVLQDVQKPQQPDSEFITNGNISIGSSLQMMGFEIPSSTPDHWNQDLFHENGRISDLRNCADHILQENLNSSINYLPQTGMSCPQIQKDWNSKNWGQDSTIKTSSLLKFLFGTDSQPQNSSLENQAMNYQSPTRYQMNEYDPYLPQLSPLIKPSLPNKQPANPLRFSYNNTPLLNAKAASLNDIRASLIPSAESQFPSSNINTKPNLHKGVHRETRGLSSVAKRTSSEPVLKRQRIETPSPLPSIKVRKEKMGDRITVLQQLVSPFGKTDTASVLHEAIEYIKFLHDQVSVLSTAYMKNGSYVEHQQAANKFTAKVGPNQDLKSRGLCLVPISSTFPVASETATDFWTPTFGGTSR